MISVIVTDTPFRLIVTDRFGIVTAHFGDRDRRDAGGRAQRIEFTVLEKLSGLHGGP